MEDRRIIVRKKEDDRQKSRRVRRQAGSVRDLRGVFYTAPDIVAYIARQAMSRLTKALDESESQAEFEARLLAMRILDPAVGSGRFLLAAFRMLIERIRLAKCRFPNLSLERLVVRVADGCLYGADKDSMAIQRTHLAIRMELRAMGCFDSGEMLKWHIIHGDGVTGFLTADELIDRSTTLSSMCKMALESIYMQGDAQICATTATLRAAHSKYQKLAKTTKGREDDASSWIRLPSVDAYPDDEQQNTMLLWAESRLFHDLRMAACKTLCLPMVPDNHASAAYGWHTTFEEGIHWFLAFPDVFCRGRGCFDVVLGNPPWMLIKKNPDELKNFKATMAVLSRTKKLLYDLGPKGNDSNGNIYSAFVQRMAKAVSCSANSLGALGVIVPMQCLYEKDKSPDRKALLEHFRHLRIYKFSGWRQREVFPSVNGEFVIIIAKSLPALHDGKLKGMTRATYAFEHREVITMFEEPTRLVMEPDPYVLALHGADVEETMSIVKRFIVDGPPPASLPGDVWTLGDLMEFRCGVQAYYKKPEKILDLSSSPDPRHTHPYVKGRVIDPYKLQLGVVARAEKGPKKHDGVWYLCPEASVEDVRITISGETRTVRTFNYGTAERESPQNQRLIVKTVAGHTFAVSDRGIRACVVDNNITMDNNVIVLWIKEKMLHDTRVPQDIHFYCAVFNSVISTTRLCDDHVSGHVKQAMMRRWPCPHIEVGQLVLMKALTDEIVQGTLGFAIDDQDFISLRDATVPPDFLDLLDPIESMFTAELRLSDAKIIPTTMRSRQLADLIACGARVCARLYPSRGEARSVKIPGMKWIEFEMSKWSNSERDFRRSEVALNHLVALYYYKNNIHEYRAICNRMRVHIESSTSPTSPLANKRAAPVHVARNATGSVRLTCDVSEVAIRWR